MGDASHTCSRPQRCDRYAWGDLSSRPSNSALRYGNDMGLPRVRRVWRCDSNSPTHVVLPKALHVVLEWATVLGTVTSFLRVHKRVILLAEGSASGTSMSGGYCGRAVTLFPKAAWSGLRCAGVQMAWVVTLSVPALRYCQPPQRFLLGCKNAVTAVIRGVPLP